MRSKGNGSCNYVNLYTAFLYENKVFVFHVSLSVSELLGHTLTYIHEPLVALPARFDRYRSR